MSWTDRQFEELFRAAYPKVLRAAHCLLGDRASAEDVVQEAFARLLARDPLPADQAERWVFRVSRNLAISRWRQTRRLMPLIDAEAHEGWDQGVELERRSLALKTALDTLPKKQREVVALRIYGELSYQDIAKATGRTLGAIKQELHRAKLALTAKLNGRLAEANDAW